MQGAARPTSRNHCLALIAAMLAASGVLAAVVRQPASAAFWTPPPAAPADFGEAGRLYDQLRLGRGPGGGGRPKARARQAA